MRKLLAFICLIVGSACLGVGGTLLAAAILPLEGVCSILLGGIWLYLSEILLDQDGRPRLHLMISTIRIPATCSISDGLIPLRRADRIQPLQFFKTLNAMI
ncbi:MAG: hypothetical protein AAF649_08580 [Verrucomicrobiota bacterium]